MSERELWEIVRADELKVGDVIVDDLIFDDDDDFGLAPIGEIRHTETRVFNRYKNGSGTEYSLAKKRAVFRRIPDADDPRVLRKILFDIAKESGWSDDKANRIVDEWIDQVRRELESEGSDEI